MWREEMMWMQKEGVVWNGKQEWDEAGGDKW